MLDFRRGREAHIVAAATLLLGGTFLAAAGQFGDTGNVRSAATGFLQQLAAFDKGAFWSFFAALFAIMNPVIAVPLFVRITRQSPAASRRRLCFVSSLTVLLALVVAGLLGQELLDFFAISVGAFRIAGGVVVLLMGLAMLHAKSGETENGESDGDATVTDGRSQAICPIAIPLLAGPGGIATIILQSKAAAVPSDYGLIACAVALMVALTYVTLRLAAPIARLLGSTGLMVATRLIGMIVAAIAVDMMVAGLCLSFPQLM
jgi:multiple antibiotic resistance protein